MQKFDQEDDDLRESSRVSVRKFRRFVALGDSQTEGLHDYRRDGVPRGWADRLAEHLAAKNPGLLYANLAVRGKRVAEIRAHQLDAALELKPDLATVVGGVNDLVRPRFDVDEVASELEEMYSALRSTGCEVMTCTFPLVSTGLTRHIGPRTIAVNEAIRAAAERHGVILVELEDLASAADPRVWSWDRIHLNTSGHGYLADAFMRALEGGERWDVSLPPSNPSHVLTRLWVETTWIVRFVVPKIGRLLIGKSSGDGRVAKRPNLQPLDFEENEVPPEP